MKTVFNKFKFNCNDVSTSLSTKLNYTDWNSDEKYEAPCKKKILLDA